MLLVKGPITIQIYNANLREFSLAQEDKKAWKKSPVCVAFETITRLQKAVVEESFLLLTKFCILVSLQTKVILLVVPPQPRACFRDVWQFGVTVPSAILVHSQILGF